MEKINDALFQKHKMSKEEQFFTKGGESGYATHSCTTTCNTTWFFFEDCTETTDTEADLGILPAANNVPSR